MKTQILLAVLLCLAVAGETSYGSGYTTGSEPSNFPPYDPNFFDQSSGSSQSANQYTFSAINNAQSQIISSTRSIDSLFSRLPSSGELDELILGADSVAILKTVQTLASDDSIPCSYIVDYLLEMLGRIRAAI